MTTIDEPATEPPREPPVEMAEPDGDELVAKKKHSLGLRWMHWINFPVLMVMMWSGMRIYWADLREPYAFGIFGWELFEFWPDRVSSFLELEAKLAKGIAFHLVFGWFFVINGFAYVVYLSRKGNWRYLVPDKQGVKDTYKVVLHDLQISKEEPPQGKYNAMQQLTYTAVIVMAAVLVATGFAIYKPGQLSLLEAAFGGYDYARLIHFSVTVLLMGFFALHLLQVARAGWRNFTSIITGYRLEKRSDHVAAPADDQKESVES